MIIGIVCIIWGAWSLFAALAVFLAYSEYYRYFGYGGLISLISLIGSIIPFILAIVAFLIYSNCNKLKRLVEEGKYIEAKNATLIWMILGFIFAWVVVGVLLLIAYLKYDDLIRYATKGDKS